MNDERTDVARVATLEAQLALARAVGDAWKAYAQAEVAIRRADYDAIGSAAFQLEGEAVSAVLALKALGIDPEAP